MKNKLVKELLSRSIAFTMVTTTALGLGLSGNGSFELLSNTIAAEAATIDSTIKNGDQVVSITYDSAGSDGYTVTTANGTCHIADDDNSPLTYVSAKNEISASQAAQALTEKKNVKVYTKNYKGLFGSYTGRTSEYFRIGQLITTDSGIAAMKASDASITSADDVSLGKDITTSKLKDAADGSKEINGLHVKSSSDNLNSVVVSGVNAASTLKASIRNSSIENLGESDGNNDVCDFDGWGIGIAAYGNTVTTISNTSIKTTGVGRTAVEADAGADVLIDTCDIDVLGGTIFADYQNTADQTKMVNPPWVLGITGSARATNLLGDFSTMTVFNSDVYADSWGVLSTDACKQPVLNVVNTTIGMDLSGDDLTSDTGYATYAIGNATENFLGSILNVPTYATICANGDNNVLNYGATKAGTAITTQKYNGTAFADSAVSVTPKESKVTVVNSENFGVDIWGQGTVNVKEGTTFNTASAAFLIKTGGYNGGTINLDNAQINVKDRTILQMIDNEDSAASGIAFPDGYQGPVFTNCVYKEAEGWSTGNSGKGVGGATVLNVTNTKLDGNIYNGSGYQVAGSELTVNLGANAILKGAISATAIKHSTDGGTTQNTAITMDKYYQFGHVVNNPYLNGVNNVTVNLSDNAVWNVEGTNYLTSLTVASGAKLNGTVYVNDTAVNALTPGTTYTGTIKVVANQPADDKGNNGDKGNKGHKTDNKKK